MPDTLPLGGPVGHLSRQTQPGTSIPAHTHVGPQCQQEEQAGPRATKTQDKEVTSECESMDSVIHTEMLASQKNII